MDDILMRFALAILGIVIGGSMLLFGRKYYWALLGVMMLFLGANLLATYKGLENPWLLITAGNWVEILIALAIGLAGLLVGRWDKDIALTLIGFSAGAYIASFFDRILLYMSGQTDITLTWWLVLLFGLAGILGIYLIRRSPDEALVLISVVLGTSVITSALNLSDESSFTAVITLSLALVGILFQYAAYMKETGPSRRILGPVPAAASEDLPYD